MMTAGGGDNLHLQFCLYPIPVTLPSEICMHPSDRILKVQGMIHCSVCGHSNRECTDIVVCTSLITPDLSAGLVNSIPLCIMVPQLQSFYKSKHPYKRSQWTFTMIKKRINYIATHAVQHCTMPLSRVATYVATSYGVAIATSRY